MSYRTDFANDQGAVAPFFAIVLVVFASVAGLSIDARIWKSQQQKSQELADFAALAGVATLAGGSEEQAKAAVGAYIIGNGGKPGTFTSVVDAGARSVSVTIDHTAPRYFSALMLMNDPQIRVSAQAAFAEKSHLCVIAMDDTAPMGVRFHGDGKLSAPGCMIWSNSTSNSSIKIEKKIDVLTGGLCAVGGALNTTTGIVSPKPEPRCSTLADPYVNFKLSVPTYCDFTAFNSNAAVVHLVPGVYCKGITISSDRVIAAPGIYYIVDGDVAISGTSEVDFSESGIYLAGKTVGINVKGDSILRITAPRGGAMEGMAIAMDPAAIPAKTSTFAGSSKIFISGVMHMPNQELVISGDSVGVANLENAIFVAKQVDFGGGAEWTWTAVSGLPSAYARSSGRLVK